MLKKSKVFIFLLLAVFSFSQIKSSIFVFGGIMGLFGALASAPFYKDAYCEKQLAKKLLELYKKKKLSKEKLYNYLINFFSNEHDSATFIKQIDKNKNDEKVLWHYLLIAANRINNCAENNFDAFKKAWYVIIAAFIFTSIIHADTLMS